MPPNPSSQGLPEASCSAAWARRRESIGARSQKRGESRQPWLVPSFIFRHCHEPSLHLKWTMLGLS
jgi:hypothetical protein